MIRTIFWLIIYFIFLGALSFRVKYKDGLKITLIGWFEYLEKRRKDYEQTD
jgi:hypothetical protein